MIMQEVIITIGYYCDYKHRVRHTYLQLSDGKLGTKIDQKDEYINCLIYFI